MTSLQSLMQEQLPEGGVAIPGARDAHIEVLEIATGRVWMTVEPATQQDYEALLEGLDESLRGIGIGAAAMDSALFQYSPNGEGEPVRERTIGGRRFINVAIPTPTKTLWHFGSGMRSFQGPVTLPKSD